MSRSDPPDPGPPRPVILLVDDEPTNVAVLGEALRSEGEIRFALSGEAALRVMASEPTPSIVLLDVMMPGMSGFEVCARLKDRAEWRDVPVLFITALADEASEIRGLAAGGVDYIHKPFHAGIVRHRVRVHLHHYLLQRALRESELRFRVASTITSDLIYEWEAERDRLRFYAAADDAAARRAPADSPETGLTLEQWFANVHPDDVAKLDAVRTLPHLDPLDGDRRVELEYKVIDRAGAVRVFRDRARLLVTPSSTRVIGSCLDITESRRAEAEIELASRVFETMDESVVVTDLDGRIRLHNPSFGRQLGFEPAGAMGRALDGFFAAGEAPGPLTELLAATVTAGRWTGRIELTRKDASSFPAQVTAITVRDRRDVLVHLAWIFRDLSVEEASRRELEHLALHDPLTGLENRFMMRASLERAIAAETGGERIAVLLLDLDGFKLVNDSLGHAVGDALLCEVADRLRRGLRSGDHVARLGGDEFAVIARVAGARADAEQVARKLLGALDRPIDLEGGTIRIGASIGICMYPDDADTPESLLMYADAAMYAAKASGKNRFDWYTPDLVARADAEARLLQELRLAVERREFVVHYQPVVELASGRIVGAEALVRWLHPQEGLLPPARFIDVAETSELILGIGAQVLETAAAASRRFRALAGPDFRMAINVSARQVQEPDFAAELLATLERLGVGPEAIEIEVTETVLMADVDAARVTLSRLEAEGCRIAIDDFGTGYSSLAYLRRLQFDRIKIDRSFVSDLDESSAARSIVAAVIEMASGLSVGTLAEGVETEAQREVLLELGCRHAQGFLFARPMPESDLAARLRAQAPERTRDASTEASRRER